MEKQSKMKCKDGLYLTPDNRIIEKRGKSLRLYWTTGMDGTLQKFYSFVAYEDLAKMLGVSISTIRKRVKELRITNIRHVDRNGYRIPEKWHVFKKHLMSECLYIWPIDYDKSIIDVMKWHNEWKKMRFGIDSLNPEHYYNISEDGRYVLGEKDGTEINFEKSLCDSVLKLLLRIRYINNKLIGRGLMWHLTSEKYNQLKKERVGYYEEFLNVLANDRHHHRY